MVRKVTTTEQAERDVAAARQRAVQRIDEGYAVKVEEGFEHDGQTWPLGGQAQGRMQRLATRVIDFSELPRGKPAHTVRDMAGGKHDLDQAGIKDLVRAGHDRLDLLDETHDGLLEDVEAATTVTDLDVIDWPDTL